MDDQTPNPVHSRGDFKIWRLVGTLLSLGLLVYLVWLQGWEEFYQALRQLPLSNFLAALGVMLLSRIAITLRWYVLLRSAKVRMPFGQCIRLVFMGLFASNFLPSTVGGDLVRLAGAMYLRLDAGVSAASLLVDRLVGMAGMATLLPMGLSAVLTHTPAQSLAPDRITAFLASGFVPPKFVRKFWDRGLGFVRSLLQSSRYWLRNPASLLWAFLFTLCHMVCTFLCISFLLSGMGEPLSFWWIGGLWSFSYFISLAPISFNGLGLQEVSIAYLYSQFGGISMHTGLALAVLWRMLNLFYSLPGALFLPDILRPLPRLQSQPAPSVASGPEPKQS